MSSDLEALAERLSADDDYRVLRRLPVRSTINPKNEDIPTLVGMAIDIETTGLDPASDEIIELALVPFTFSGGRIFEVLPAFCGLRQPAKPIPPEITAITGIDDEMVAGRAIDTAEVARFIGGAAIIIAHHAEFDRPFAERFCDAFISKCWACSATEIDWRAEGRESTKLAWLLSEGGYFYQRHRAESDCRALIELLAMPLPKAGLEALAVLLDRARQPTIRIFAQGSPFETKDLLKARGYRWSDGKDGKPKSWFFDAAPEMVDAEVDWLQREIWRRADVSPRIDRLTAYDRFSQR